MIKIIVTSLAIEMMVVLSSNVINDDHFPLKVIVVFPVCFHKV